MTSLRKLPGRPASGFLGAGVLALSLASPLAELTPPAFAEEVSSAEGWGPDQLVLDVEVIPEVVILKKGTTFHAEVQATVSLETLRGENLEMPVGISAFCEEPTLHEQLSPESMTFEFENGHWSDSKAVDIQLTSFTFDLTMPTTCHFSASLWNSTINQSHSKEVTFTVLPFSSQLPQVVKDSAAQVPALATNTCPLTTADFVVEGEVKNVPDGEEWDVWYQVFYEAVPSPLPAQRGASVVGSERFALEGSGVELQAKNLMLFWVNLWVQKPGDASTKGPVTTVPLRFAYQDCSPVGSANFDPQTLGLSTLRDTAGFSGERTAPSTLRGSITFPGMNGTETFQYKVPGAAAGFQEGTLDVDFVDGEGTIEKEIEFDQPGTFTATITRDGHVITTADIVVRDGLISASMVRGVKNLCPVTTASATIEATVFSARGLALRADLRPADSQGSAPLQTKTPTLKPDGSTSVTFDGLKAGNYVIALTLVDSEDRVIEAVTLPLAVQTTHCAPGEGTDPVPPGSDGETLPKTGAGVGLLLPLGMLFLSGGVLLTRAAAQRTRSRWACSAT